MSADKTGPRDVAAPRVDPGRGLDEVASPRSCMKFRMQRPWGMTPIACPLASPVLASSLAPSSPEKKAFTRPRPFHYPGGANAEKRYLLMVLRAGGSRFLAAAISLLVLGLAVPARADLVLSIQSDSVPANSSGDSIDVTLQNTGAGVRVVSFRFEIQASNNNLDFTSVTTDTTVARYIFGGATSQDGPNITDSIGTNPPTISASDASTNYNGVYLASGFFFGLGHVTFNAGPAAGPTTITFVTANTSFVGFSSSVTYTPTPGIITVTPSAVPEPSSTVLMGIGAIAALGYALRRRRAKAAA